MQTSLTRKHDGAIVAGSGYAAWSVAERLYQKLRNLLGMGMGMAMAMAMGI